MASAIELERYQYFNHRHWNRKCVACLNGILRSKDIRKERKLSIYNALIKSSLLYGSETWTLTENNKRRCG